MKGVVKLQIDPAHLLDWQPASSLGRPQLHRQQSSEPVRAGCISRADYSSPHPTRLCLPNRSAWTKSATTLRSALSLLLLAETSSTEFQFVVTASLRSWNMPSQPFGHEGANHGSIWDSWPTAFSGYPRGH